MALLKLAEYQANLQSLRVATTVELAQLSGLTSDDQERLLSPQLQHIYPNGFRTFILIKVKEILTELDGLMENQVPTEDKDAVLKQAIAFRSAQERLSLLYSLLENGQQLAQRINT